ncbi:single-stranded DNA-binding protein [Alkalinema sp. FACHB-956]|uniref:single-stranded DNA-binding protein n=1 Tax=Alkalinema sp. FACHB-956 TaxID=2692768 RepID=UPI0016866979|nr:single-stranded DNA-binding protein [Alkalinema sp. FACHB-956]MBD2326459.1 single-stranded DNA-binding protein [Alkalinema sp. FACHB-956]
MNSCIIMAEITQEPQLRYTQDNQMAIAEMRVQFPGLRPEDPPSSLKVLGWGNLAQEVHQQYHLGDQVVIEGRLSMNTVDRPEGFKEKQAELTISKIYSLGAAAAMSTPPATTSPAPEAPAPKATSTRSKAPKTTTPSPANNETDFDDIPF